MPRKNIRSQIRRIAMPAIAGVVGLLAAGAALADIQVASHPGACSRFSAWSGDGCAASKGSFFIARYFGAASFYEWATQTQQSWANGPHPWAWNSPGIDYGIGPDRDARLADPATASLPKGCAYLPGGAQTGGPAIRCAVGARDVVLSGLDLSLHGCTPVVLESTSDGILTIENSNLRNGPNCGGPDGAMVRIVNPHAGLALKKVLVDAAYDADSAPLVRAGSGTNSSGSFLLLNSAVLNGPPGPLSGMYAGTVDIENSDLIGFAVASEDGRGDRGQRCDLGCAAFPTSYRTVIFRGNVVATTNNSKLILVPRDEARNTTTQDSPTRSYYSDHNILVLNAVQAARANVAANLKGVIKDNILELDPGLKTPVIVGMEVNGVGFRQTVTIVAILGNGKYAVSGSPPDGAFASASLQKPLSTSAFVGLPNYDDYDAVLSSDNVADYTAAYSCSSASASTKSRQIVRNRVNLVTGQDQNGAVAIDRGSLCT